MAQPRIGIILSTVRPGRFADTPARWFLDLASRRTDLAFEIVDLRDYPLPFFGADDVSAGGAAPGLDAIGRWQAKLEELDGFVFVTAEYQHSVPGVLKNALDYAGQEVRRKPAAFIGYGGVGGARAVEHLRQICAELQMVPVRAAVHIGMEPYLAVTEKGATLSDFDFLERSAVAVLADLAWWTQTLKAAREAADRRGAVAAAEGSVATVGG